MKVIRDSYVYKSINQITIDCRIKWCKRELHNNYDEVRMHKEVMAIFIKHCKYNFKFIGNFYNLNKLIVLTLSTDLLPGTSVAI